MESLFDQCCETDETKKKANMVELDVIAQWIYLFAQRYCLPDKQTPVLLLIILDQCLQKSIYASKDLLKIQTDFPGIDIRADKETVGKKKKQTHTQKLS